MRNYANKKITVRRKTNLLSNEKTKTPIMQGANPCHYHSHDENLRV
uniref:Uncharacterized protein n=1 Tax=virus sp. ctkyY8 TaxID=2827995 RepID=A0A8S5RDW6_9VIRU|nr:MAG TPA: hypothetical protein [virus sp. ctkyY8]